MDEKKDNKHYHMMGEEPKMLKSRGAKPGDMAVGEKRDHAPGHESAVTEKAASGNDGSKAASMPSLDFRIKR